MTKPRDHPRIRGEHEGGHKATKFTMGIIPAYAGSTLTQRARTAPPTGSSPHTRGAPRATGAGQRRGRDHPRIRGEHQVVHAQRAEARGIIPAYAGSTGLSSTARTRFTGSSPHTRGARLPRRRPRLPSGDHPRIRGEHLLPPLERAVDDGIIPAYAGSTPIRAPMRTPTAGSSPHTRGAHLTTSTNIPHSAILDSVVRVHPRISTSPWLRRYLPNFLAARYLLALLHPFCGVPSIVAPSVPRGLFINSTPSQSTGFQSG